MATDNEVNAAGRVLYPNTWDRSLPEISEARRKTVGEALDAAAQARTFDAIPICDLRALVDAMRSGDVKIVLRTSVLADMPQAACAEVKAWLDRCNAVLLGAFEAELVRREAAERTPDYGLAAGHSPLFGD